MDWTDLACWTLLAAGSLLLAWLAVPEHHHRPHDHIDGLQRTWQTTHTHPDPPANRHHIRSAPPASGKRP